MDDRGFVNSAARCEGTRSAAAIGRTQRSLVVVCKLAGGGYEYVGVRMSDGATLKLDGVTASADGFRGDNDGATYDVSPRELLVKRGNSILTREPWLDYRAPGR